MVLPTQSGGFLAVAKTASQSFKVFQSGIPPRPGAVGNCCNSRLQAYVTIDDETVMNIHLLLGCLRRRLTAEDTYCSFRNTR